MGKARASARWITPGGWGILYPYDVPKVRNWHELGASKYGIYRIPLPEIVEISKQPCGWLDGKEAISDQWIEVGEAIANRYAIYANPSYWEEIGVRPSRCDTVDSGVSRMEALWWLSCKRRSDGRPFMTIDPVGFAASEITKREMAKIKIEQKSANERAKAIAMSLKKQADDIANGAIPLF